MHICCQDNFTTPRSLEEALSGSELWVIFNPESGYIQHLPHSLNSSGRQRAVGRELAGERTAAESQVRLTQGEPPRGRAGAVGTVKVQILQSLHLGPAPSGCLLSPQEVSHFNKKGTTELESQQHPGADTTDPAAQGKECT